MTLKWGAEATALSKSRPSVGSLTVFNLLTFGRQCPCRLPLHPCISNSILNVNSVNGAAVQNGP